MSNKRRIRNKPPKRRQAPSWGPTVEDIARVGLQLLEGAEKLKPEEQAALVAVSIHAGEKMLDLLRSEEENGQ